MIFFYLKYVGFKVLQKSTRHMLDIGAEYMELDIMSLEIILETMRA